MLSEKRLFHLHKSVATFCIALFVTFFSPHILYPATEQSYTREIELYVAEDKVYLLENIRQNITRPSEKTVVDALLCESGPEALEPTLPPAPRVANAGLKPSLLLLTPNSSQSQYPSQLNSSASGWRFPRAATARQTVSPSRLFALPT